MSTCETRELWCCISYVVKSAQIKQNKKSLLWITQKNTKKLYKNAKIDYTTSSIYTIWMNSKPPPRRKQAKTNRPKSQRRQGQRKSCAERYKTQSNECL